jgi:hypothetical protein
VTRLDPQTAEWLVLAFLVAVVAVTVALDVWLYSFHGASCTISHVVRRWIERYPSVLLAVVFGSGIFLGHVFFPY